MNHTYKYKNYKEMLLGILGQYKFPIPKYPKFVMSSVSSSIQLMIFSMLIVVVRGVILLLPSVVTQRIIDVILPQGSFSLLFMYAVLCFPYAFYL